MWNKDCIPDKQRAFAAGTPPATVQSTLLTFVASHPLTVFTHSQWPRISCNQSMPGVNMRIRSYQISLRLLPPPLREQALHPPGLLHRFRRHRPLYPEQSSLFPNLSSRHDRVVWLLFCTLASITGSYLSPSSTDQLYPSCFTQKYNSDRIDYYSNFCGHGSTSFPDLRPHYKVSYTNEVSVTDTAGKSVGTTAAVVIQTYSAAGTYASVFPDVQDTSDTGDPTTDGSNTSARVTYIILGVLGLFALALVASLCVVAHLARRPRSNSDAFASLPPQSRKSTWSRPGN